MQTFRDVYQYRSILAALTSKQLKSQYRSMSLGFLWALLNPLVMVTVLSFVFIVFWGAGLEQPARVVVALIPYNFFAYCLSACAASVVGNSSLVKKVYFPRQILPFAVILTNLVHFAVQSSLIVLVLLIFPAAGPVLGWNLLWLLPILVITVGLCVGIGLLAAALTVVFRDTQYIVQSLLTVMFWCSPVIYDAGAMFEEAHARGEAHVWLERLYYLNPVAGLLESYRDVLFHGVAPDMAILGGALLITLIVGAIGVRTFFVHEPDFADLIR